jgi:hypothetical protein
VCEVNNCADHFLGVWFGSHVRGGIDAEEGLTTHQFHGLGQVVCPGGRIGESGSDERRRLRSVVGDLARDSAATYAAVWTAQGSSCPLPPTGFCASRLQSRHSVMLAVASTHRLARRPSILTRSSIDRAAAMESTSPAVEGRATSLIPPTSPAGNYFLRPAAIKPTLLCIKPQRREKGRCAGGGRAEPLHFHLSLPMKPPPRPHPTVHSVIAPWARSVPVIPSRHAGFSLNRSAEIAAE